MVRSQQLGALGTAHLVANIFEKFHKKNRAFLDIVSGVILPFVYS